MTVSVGLFATGFERLKARIDAMDLDIEICTFDSDGNFDISGKKTPASEVTLDYLWLGPDLAGDLLDHAFRQAPAVSQQRFVQGGVKPLPAGGQSGPGGESAGRAKDGKLF